MPGLPTAGPAGSDLQEVADRTVRMLSLVRESVGHAHDALIGADPSAADRATEVDREIDRLQAALERRILVILTRQRVAANDLRFLGAMHRTLTDVERAGDYALHVAKAGAALADRPPLKRYLDLRRILEILDRMLETAIRAVADADEASAREAHAMDDEIDDLIEQVQRELLTYMMADPTSIPVATRLLATARHLERLGDHIENVAEHVIFWLTGKRL